MDMKKPQYLLLAGVAIVLLFSSILYLGSYQEGGLLAQRLESGGKRAEASPEADTDNLELLARVIQGEAGDEPYLGKVAVGAVMLNRMRSGTFPNSLSGVIFEPFAFESVSNGLIWQFSPSEESLRAANDALSGMDPTYGALYFWNPSKPVNPWVWTRQIITQIGNHVFAR